jgi:phosphomannomutase/phosphoglucomutase
MQEEPQEISPKSKLNVSHNSLDPTIFRTYDIRGIVDKNLTPEVVYLIGQAIGSIVREQDGDRIATARDGRLSSPTLSKALCEGIASTGCDIVDLGMVPTPILYYASHVIEKQAGVMLTGSHNPPEYNGLKMVINGKTLAEDEIQGIYERIKLKHFHLGSGSITEMNIVDRYINHITYHVHLTRPMKIVIDAGNGVAGLIAGDLYRALGCEVIELFCDVDGRFPNHEADPSQIENLGPLIDAVNKEKAEIGLAFDGDGDRLGVVTKHGEIIWPDRLLILFAKALLKEHPTSRIIYDVKCSDHLATVIHALGGEPIMWKTGHSLIKAKLIEMQAKLAGEMSGHFFFRDKWYGFDDALYAGARLLEILAREDDKGPDIFASIPNSINTPELKISVEENEKFDLMRALKDNANFQDAKEIVTIDGLRVNFEDGFGLIRPSNTTPYLILRFEALNEVILKTIQSRFRDWLLSVRPDLVLPF